MKLKTTISLRDILIIILIASFVFLISNIKRNSSKYNDLSGRYLYEIAKSQEEKSRQLSRLEYQLNSRAALSIGLFENSKEKLLSIVFKNQNCSQCAQEIIMEANIIAEKIGIENIVLIGDFQKPDELDEYFNSVPCQFKKFLFKDVFEDQSILSDDTELIILHATGSLTALGNINYFQGEMRIQFIEKLGMLFRKKNNI